MPDYRSVSQYKQLTQCPKQYQLQRLDKLPVKPAAWFPQGSAVHAGIEAYHTGSQDLGLVWGVYASTYDAEVAKYCETYPNFDWWFWSGSYDPHEDLARRFDDGWQHVLRVVQYYTKHREEKAWKVELPFEIELGGVNVRGAIDVVVQTPGKKKPRDYKTGRRPGDPFQLAVYRMALIKQYGLSIDHGDFFPTRNVKPSPQIDLRDFTEDVLGEMFSAADDQILAGDFPANPSEENCRFCGVRDHCSDAV